MGGGLRQTPRGNKKSPPGPTSTRSGSALDVSLPDVRLRHREVPGRHYLRRRQTEASQACCWRGSPVGR